MSQSSDDKQTQTQKRPANGALWGILGVLSDVLLWVVVLGVAGGAVYNVFWLQPAKERQVLTLAFHDANEIGRGANVRMMGVSIGYVDDIRFAEDHVDVVISTKPGAMKIPKGTKATIKFTGLVGAKSIELMPPADSVAAGSAAAEFLSQSVDGLATRSAESYHGTRQGAPYILVEEPIRLKDTIQYNIDIAKALQDGAENFSDFFGKKKPIEELQYNAKMSNARTRQMVSWMDGVLVQSGKAKARYTASRAKVLNLVREVSGGSVATENIVGAVSFNSSVLTVVEYVDDVFQEAGYRLRGFQKQQHYATAKGDIVDTGERLKRHRQRVEHWGPSSRLARLEEGLCQSSDTLERARQIKGNRLMDELTYTRETIQWAACVLEDLGGFTSPKP